MTPPPRRSTRVGLALALVVLAPLGAEYVTGYDTSTGDPAALLQGLLFLAPLYGVPALLIRECARRLDLGWSGVALLAAAFGVVQAGVVDQSLFNDSYRDIEYWEQGYAPTLVAALGFPVALAVQFVAGHVIWSYVIPIVLAEALAPAASRLPWLRAPGLLLVTVAYLTTAVLIWWYHQQTETDHASAGEVAGASLVAVLCVVAALTAGRRRSRCRPGGAPAPLVVAGVAVVATVCFNLLPGTWWGTAAGVALLAVVAVGVGLLARSCGWQPRHVASVAAGALVGRAVIGFLVDPLGDVDPVAKYAHNGVFLAGAVLLGWWAVRRHGTAGRGGPHPDGVRLPDSTSPGPAPG